MGITRIKHWIICGLLVSACSSNNEIDGDLTAEVLRAQIHQEARFNRSDQSELPKIKLLSVEVIESEILPKLVDTDRDKLRVHYKAEIEILEDCAWGTDRDSPRGFTRFLIRPKDDKDNWMHITNSTISDKGDQEEVEHYFELTKTDNGWVDGYNNNY